MTLVGSTDVLPSCHVEQYFLRGSWAEVQICHTPTNISSSHVSLTVEHIHRRYKMICSCGGRWFSTISSVVTRRDISVWDSLSIKAHRLTVRRPKAVAQIGKEPCHQMNPSTEKQKWSVSSLAEKLIYKLLLSQTLGLNVKIAVHPSHCVCLHFLTPL
jgi:hypothetical protein